MAANERANFGSKIGIILASAGSAVGLGNIWRFPYLTGEDGGAAFILVYICCVLFLGIPAMVAEFVVGRHSRANTGQAYDVLAPGTPWKLVGLMGVLAAFLILGYYGVVAGWTLEYTVASASGAFLGAKDFMAYFNDFVSNPWRPVVYMFLFMLLTHVIVVRGVKEGIERCSKVMMPLLLLIICVLVVCSLSLPVPVEARLQQDHGRGGARRHGADVFLHERGHGLPLHLCVLLYERRQPDEDGGQRGLDRHFGGRAGRLCHLPRRVLRAGTFR